MKILFNLFYKYNDALMISLFDQIKNQKLWFKIDQMRLDSEYSFDEGLILLNLTANAEYFKDGRILLTDVYEANSLWIFIDQGTSKISLSCMFESLEKYLEVEPFFFNKMMNGDENFIIGFASDYEFSIKEGLEDIQTHELLYGKVPAFKIKKDEEGYEYIDKNKCYGRTEYIRGIGVTVAWRMYFGKLFYSSIESEIKIRLLKTQESKIIGDIIFIELFRNPEDVNTNEGYAKLKEFRERTELDYCWK